VPDTESTHLIEITCFLGDDERTDPFRSLAWISNRGDDENLPDAAVRDEDFAAV